MQAMAWVEGLVGTAEAGGAVPLVWILISRSGLLRRPARLVVQGPPSVTVVAVDVAELEAMMRRAVAEGISA